MNKKFNHELEEKTNDEMIKYKQNAMQEKEEFIKGDTNKDKSKFLEEYGKSNEILAKDYKGYSIDKESLKILMKIDIDKIILQRRKNAAIIYDRLSKYKEIKFLESYSNRDCLLFVPIILDSKIRDRIRKYLIDRKIYLPIHWVLEERLNNIFERELSLICDQRYTEEEIAEYIIRVGGCFERKF